MKSTTSTAVPTNAPIMKGRYLSQREREGLFKTIESSQRMTSASADITALATAGGNTVAPAGTVIHPSRMSDRIKGINKVLKEGTPPQINSAERDNLQKRREELESEFEHDQVLETREELTAIKRSNPAYMTAMAKARMRPKYEGKITEWKNIMRTLDPENPEADNLDQLRKARN